MADASWIFRDVLIIWKKFLSNQFGKVKVAFYLPYFIPTNQIQDSFFGKDRPRIPDQYINVGLIM